MQSLAGDEFSVDNLAKLGCESNVLESDQFYCIRAHLEALLCTQRHIYRWVDDIGHCIVGRGVVSDDFAEKQSGSVVGGSRDCDAEERSVLVDQSRLEEPVSLCAGLVDLLQ